MTKKKKKKLKYSLSWLNPQKKKHWKNWSIGITELINNI